MDINNEPMINEEINDREVRLIGKDGEQLGVMSIAAAMAKAEEASMDLVKIVPGAQPPVCKLMDYDKHRFEQSKRERELRKNQRIVELKEVQLSATIEENDLQTKLKNALKFLEEGDKVKVSIRFRGRQIAHTNIGMQIMVDFAKRIDEVGNVERRPLLEGRHMIMILAPKAEKKSFAEKSQQRKATTQAETREAVQEAAATEATAAPEAAAAPKEQPKKKVKRESENMI
jgi:translation initiation factor IF-3